MEVVQVRTSGLGSPSRREFHEGLGFGTLTASHHQSYQAPQKVLIHVCALRVTTLQIPAPASSTPLLCRCHTYRRQTNPEYMVSRRWPCPEAPVAHVHGWGGQRLSLLPQAPRASHLPAVIYQKYINPEPVSIRVSIPGTVPDKPYLCAGALAPCSRACQSCSPHPACGAALVVTSRCVGGQGVSLF